ncbi:class I SAM-dependent methyltransferase [Corallococcus sp. M34]|uniref:class I SAM-dependent methyltransferase n=1 Tax=Citreicoccus inhibens TaxID=2849499 RepID=UPI001C2343FD|nr:class I SAM-dependent methyltransferase [Citreicoccus inhibens]MBU8894838.1 class I SAM-dependent methyltransferase [Citreicoccus inhibens]
MEPPFNAFVRAYEDDENFHYRRYFEAWSFFNALGDVRGASVLDAGCGAGLYTRRLRERGAARVVGFDIATNMLAHARMREAEAPLGIEYVLEDAANAGRLGRFDIVTAVYVLPYAETREVLRGMCRGMAEAVRPGGRLVAVAVNPVGEFSRRDYFAAHGMQILPANAEHAALAELPDGAPLRLVSHIQGKPIDVRPCRWRRATLEDELRAAGFREIAWPPLSVSPEGEELFGREHWRPLLENPPAVPLVCLK